jgi:hypothetical protein
VDISGHRFQKTPKKVQERLFEAGTRKKEQTPDAAQQFALSQFTSLEEMQRKMKPE